MHPPVPLLEEIDETTPILFANLKMKTYVW
ncbi:MAG: hypothetical protein ACI8XM_002836 [Haloarculaceae archaeon]|jgi:hypothetical protein